VGSDAEASFYDGAIATTPLLANGAYKDKADLSTFYGNLTINHRINAYISENLSGGRENDLGLTSNYLEVNYIRYNAAWRALSNVTLGGDLFYENDQESGGPYDQHIERGGGDVTAGYQFNLQLSATIHYAYIKKDSSTYLLGYYQNRAGVDVTYQF
jgi:outer membrane protein assembly factor BamA